MQLAFGGGRLRTQWHTNTRVGSAALAEASTQAAHKTRGSSVGRGLSGQVSGAVGTRASCRNAHVPASGTSTLLSSAGFPDAGTAFSRRGSRAPCTLGPDTTQGSKDCAHNFVWSGRRSRPCTPCGLPRRCRRGRRPRLTRGCTHSGGAPHRHSPRRKGWCSRSRTGRRTAGSCRRARLRLWRNSPARRQPARIRRWTRTRARARGWRGWPQPWARAGACTPPRVRRGGRGGRCAEPLPRTKTR